MSNVANLTGGGAALFAATMDWYLCGAKAREPRTRIKEQRVAYCTPLITADTYFTPLHAQHGFDNRLARSAPGKACANRTLRDDAQQAIENISMGSRLVVKLKANYSMALTCRLNPMTAGCRVWKHRYAEAMSKKLRAIQQHAHHTPLFVRWLRAEMRAEQAAGTR